MEISLHRLLAKWGALAALALAFLLAVTWITKTYLGNHFAAQGTVAALEKAVRFSPKNAEHHLTLGLMRQYNVADVDAEQAIKHFREAARLNPRDPRPWLQLAAAMEFEGKTDEARELLRHADKLAPNIPSVQWAIGNFLLLHGDVSDAFRHFRIVLAGSSRYNRILFATASKATTDTNLILDQLLPREINTELDYLHYLVDEKRAEEAQAVWQRILGNSESFEPAQAKPYFDFLIDAGRPREAREVWESLIDRGIISVTYRQSPSDLIINGKFEEELLGFGFDWHLVPGEHVLVSLDGSNYRSPSRSILIQFSGKANIAARPLYQWAIVEPRLSYRLQAMVRTEAVTSDSGPRLEVRDAYDPTLLHTFSETLTGTSGSWQTLSLEFTAGPKSELVLVAIHRIPSRKLDSLVGGRVWVDDVSLTPMEKNSVRR